MPEKFASLQTKLIHSGEPRPRIEGAVSAPIFQSTTYEADEEENYHAVRYVRLNNTPNQVMLNEKLASIQNSKRRS